MTPELNPPPLGVNKPLYFTPLKAGKQPFQKNWPQSKLDISQAFAYTETDPDCTGIGIVHSTSGTCAFDVDDLSRTEDYFKDRFADNGASLEMILGNAYRIKSPKPNKAKAIFTLSTSQRKQLLKITQKISTKYTEKADDKTITVFELRADGCQDVWHGSLYIDSNGQQLGHYEQEGCYTLTPLPDELFKLWTELLQEKCPPSNTLTPTPKPIIRTTNDQPLSLIDKDGMMSVVYLFNRMNPLPSVLESYGYKKIGDNYLSPRSTSKSPGVVICNSHKNPWQVSFSHHASDGELHSRQADAFDIAAFHSFPALSLLEAKKEFTKQMASFLYAIHPNTGEQLNIKVDAYNKANRKPSTPSIEVYSAADLMNQVLKPITFIIPSLLPAGRTLFAGEPKSGKSWLALYFGMLLASGKPIFGHQTSPQQVAYFALEDSQRRIQKRLNTISQQFNLNAQQYRNLNIGYQLPAIDNGMSKALCAYLNQHLQTSLIIIDVLAKVRPSKTTGNIYRDDYQVGDAFKQINDQFPDLAILVVHHTNKTQNTSVIGSVSGTNGLAGSFDNIFTIKDDRFSFKGRDLEEDGEIELIKDGGRYTLEPDSPANKMSDTRRLVYQAIQERYSSNKDIQRVTGLSSSDVSQQLSKLLKEGLIKKQGYGVYELA